MQDVQPLEAGVFHLESHYIKRGVASLYCVVQDGEVAIIETGTAHSLPVVQQFLSDLSIAPERVKYIMPTHVHLDHAGGAGVMMRVFPEAQLVIHSAGAKHMVDPTRLIEATRAVYGDAVFNELYGEIPPIDEDRIISVDHEREIDLNGRKLLVIDTPGHAWHHYCVVDAISEGIFSGDTFGLSYPNLLYHGKRVVLPTTTPTQFAPSALHRSIDKLMQFNPRRMYLTHFNELADPVTVVEQYRHWIDHYVALAERVKPTDGDLPEMIAQMRHMIGSAFDFSEEVQDKQLAMDIKLNCQGLIYWYQKQQRSS